MSERVDSTSDARTRNNVVRHEYRVLTEAEKAQMKEVKDRTADLIGYLKDLPSSREISLAVTKLEEACFWAVKSITK